MIIEIIFKKCASILQFNKKEDGFTFISLLLAIILTTQLIFFISLLLPILQKTPAEEATIFQFFHFLELEQMQSIELIQYQQTLLFIKNDFEKVAISQNGSNIRRQVNQLGHEVLLSNVEYYHLSSILEGTHIKIKLRIKGSKTYEKILRITE